MTDLDSQHVAGATGRRVALRTLAAMIVLIGLGTCALKLPWACPSGVAVTWLEALFTATAAVCGTGLQVCNISTRFSPIGHAVLAVLMVGGALVILAAAMSIVVGLFQLRLSRGSMLWWVLMVTVMLPIIGAGLLLIGAADDEGIVTRAPAALFATVSAVCNVGWSIGRDAANPMSVKTHLVLMPLILIGALGPAVLADLWRAMRRRSRPGRSSYTRMVLAMMAALYVFGALALFGAQLAGGADDPIRALAESSVLTVSRTTGFEPLDVADQSAAIRWLLTGLMLIGGDVRLWTTAALATVLLRGLGGSRRVAAFGRNLPQPLIVVAAAIVIIMLALPVAATWLLSLFEPYPLDRLLFEATSAAANSGLSTGITDGLTSFGKGVLIATMFVGRLAPIALLGQLCLRQASVSTSPGRSTRQRVPATDQVWSRPSL